jgi:DNA processing protein
LKRGEYSGTRITARLALEQNRDLYAVSGNGTNENSREPEHVIKQNARLVATLENLWEEVPTDMHERAKFQAQ